MSCTVVERVFESRLTLDQVRGMARDGAWCLSQYRIAYLGSFLGADGTRLTCVYRAPDAESVRAANRQNGLAYERVWRASMHGPDDTDPLAGEKAGADRTLVVVERAFAEPTTFGSVNDRGTRYRWCADAYRISFQRSYFAADQRRMLCVYRAPDAEAVRHLQIQSGMPFERVWAAALCPAT